MAKPGSFATLIEELGLAKSLDTTEDDERISAAAEEGVDEPNPARKLGPDHQAVLKMFRQVVDAITALRQDVDRLSAGVGGPSGSGRPMQKSILRADDGQISGEEFMGKALLAQTAGRITGVQVAVAEAHINAGKAPPADIVRAVLTE